MYTSEASFWNRVGGGWGQQAIPELHAMGARSCAVLEATRQWDSVQSLISVDLGKASSSWKAGEKGSIGHPGPVEKVTEDKRREEKQSPVSSCCLPDPI